MANEPDENLRFFRRTLRTCLIGLGDELIHTLAQKLKDMKLTKELVRYAKPEDLVQLGFNIFQARAVVDYWTTPLPSSSRAADSVLKARTDNIQNQPQPSESLTDIYSFRINWQAVYNVKRKTKDGLAYARDVLTKKMRPDPKLRQKIVEEVVHQVLLKVPNSKRKSMEHIYSQMLEEHPESFSETLGKGTECSGGLLHQLKTKLDNERRPDRNQHLRDAASTTLQYEQPRGKFSYGCIRWRVSDVPANITPEHVQEIKTKLQETFKTVRPKFWDWREINEMMSTTYKFQRDLINRNIEAALQQQKEHRAQKRGRRQAEQEPEGDPDADVVPAKVTMSQIHEEWPFLFSYQGMLNHFKELTKVDLEKEMKTFKEKEQASIIKFFDRLDKEWCVTIMKNMENAKRKNPDENQELKAILLMVAEFMGEKSFIDVVEDTATIETLERDQRTPQYPGLGVPAKRMCLFRAKRFFFGTDSEYYYSFNDFERAFCAVFMAYYVFNMNYPPPMQAQFDYIQRCIFHIDPIRGNKRPPKEAGGNFSSKVVHPKTSKLFKDIEKMTNQRQQENIQDMDDEGTSENSEHDNNDDEALD